MMTAPAAPAACALSALTAKPHIPRCIERDAPAGKPAKSAASQPLVLLFGRQAGSGNDDVDGNERAGCGAFGNPAVEAVPQEVGAVDEGGRIRTYRMSSEFSS